MIIQNQESAMKIKLSVIIALFICWAGLGLAGPVGDIDADGQIIIT